MKFSSFVVGSDRLSMIQTVRSHVAQSKTSIYQPNVTCRNKFSLGKDKQAMGQHRNLQNLVHLSVSFSLIILLILSAGFSFILSVIHATDLIFPGNSVLSLKFSLKIQQGAKASQISYLNILILLLILGTFVTQWRLVHMRTQYLEY